MSAFTNVKKILRENPTVSNDALSGVVEANIVNFKGSISVTTKTHQFATGDRAARVIYITPYGKVWDFISRARHIQPPPEASANRIVEYVLGGLIETTEDYKTADQETHDLLKQGHRLTIGLATDHPILNLKQEIEENQQGLCIIL